MDWNLAIDMNLEALKRVLAALVAMAGFGGVFSVGSPLPDASRRPLHAGDVASARPTLPRQLHRALLRLLRPAEAAARRLIIAAARGIAVAPPTPALRKAKPKPPPRAQKRASAFLLFDPLGNPLHRRRTSAARSVPRIWAPGCRDPIPVPQRRPPLPNDPVDTARLGLRLAALGRVLDDLPHAARRFARWRARAANAWGAQEKNAGRRHRRWPLKPGLPPGARRPGSRRPVHEIDEILGATHGLAFWAMAHPDTS